MFIKKTPEKRGARTCLHYKSVESYRSESGPKHGILLNLGSLDRLNTDQSKLLAKPIGMKIMKNKKM